MHLYETHIPVRDTIVAEKFYREVVGLPFAYRDPTRDIVFLWADVKEKAMIGLWGPGTAYGIRDEVILKCHIAFSIPLDQLFDMIEKLNESGIDAFGFGGGKAEEPTVIGWMPSAQIYFRDPDGICWNSSAFCRSSQNPALPEVTQNGRTCSQTKAEAKLNRVIPARPPKYSLSRSGAHGPSRQVR